MTTRTDVSSPVPDVQKQGEGQLHDANFALMELEKGLRSTKPGEQCEAIVHVPTLVAKYPYPILLNSAFLKLADVFRAGSNFTKLCVLKAIQGSKRHLDKIFNVDELCRRFFAVIHSNDPIARAVTLRVFGHIASIVAERKNIHHSIRNSLDSHDTMEVEAAIFATKCFAEQSSGFAAGLFQKIAEMIGGLATPVEMKLKLLPVFKFMYHDVTIAAQVNKLCGDLLQAYPSHVFVSSILNTGTQLAVATLINIEEQVTLLLKYLTDDARKSIQMIAIKNLFTLAKKAPHLWKSEYVDKLLTVAVECLHNNLREKILQVVRVLALDGDTNGIFSQQALNCLEDLCMDMCTDISTLALESTTRVKCAPKGALDEQVLLALEADIQTLFAISVAENSLSSLKRCLSCAQQLITRSPSTTTLPHFLVQCMSTVQDDVLLLVCHTLVSMSTFKRALCAPHVPVLLDLLKSKISSSSSSSSSKQQLDILVALLTVILQASCKESVERRIQLQEELLHLVVGVDGVQDFWTLYRMGRQAARLGYPLLAAKTTSTLQTKVSSESCYFWLKALTCLCEGESVLLRDVSSNATLQQLLMQAHNHYQEGLTNLKAAVTTDHPLYFQFKFARLRSDMLRAYSQLLTCCASLRLNPPPALARTSAHTTGQEIHHLSRLASQFQSCASMFNNVAAGFQTLYKSSFNCDRTTLQNIQLLQESCQVISYAIETLVLLRSNERVSPQFSSHRNSELNEHLRTLTDTNLQILRNVQEIDAETKDVPLSHRQINYLASIVVLHLTAGFSYPLYFFKSLQKVQLQLSITPSNAHADQPYQLNVTHVMALKIEGVVVDKGNNRRFREPEKVNLAVKVKPSPNVRQVGNDMKPVQLTEMVLKESAVPRNDYFSHQFLLSFKYLGHHAVKVVAGINDEDGLDWETGPSFVIHVDVIEQSHNKRR